MFYLLRKVSPPPASARVWNSYHSFGLWAQTALSFICSSKRSLDSYELSPGVAQALGIRWPGVAMDFITYWGRKTLN